MREKFFIQFQYLNDDLQQIFHLPPLLLSPPLLSLLSNSLGYLRYLRSLSPFLLSSRLPMRSFLSAYCFCQLSLVKNSSLFSSRGAWQPTSFFCSAVGSLVRVTSMIVRNRFFSTLRSPSSLGSQTSTTSRSLISVIWWSPATLRLTTSATQRALSIRRSAALIVTKDFPSPKKRVNALETQRPELLQKVPQVGLNFMRMSVSGLSSFLSSCFTRIYFDLVAINYLQLISLYFMMQSLNFQLVIDLQQFYFIMNVQNVVLQKFNIVSIFAQIHTSFLLNQKLIYIFYLHFFVANFQKFIYPSKLLVQKEFSTSLLCLKTTNYPDEFQQKQIDAINFSRYKMHRFRKQIQVFLQQFVFAIYLQCTYYLLVIFQILSRPKIIIKYRQLLQVIEKIMQNQQNLSPCRNFELRNLQNQFFSPKKNNGQNKILELPNISQYGHNKQNYSQNYSNSQCSRCKDLMLKVQHLQKVSQQVQQLKQKNEEFREEVELLSANFMYIMELAAINIVSGVKSRIKEVLAQKQKIIKRQSQAIQRLESQSLTLINKMEDQTDFQQKIQTLEEKVKQLQAQNITLKKENSKKSYKIQSEDSMPFDSTDGFSGTDGDRSPNASQKIDFHFGSLQLKHIKSTLDQRRQQTVADKRLPQRKLSPKELQSINIDDLKTKIHKMKSVLLNQRI